MQNLQTVITPELIRTDRHYFDTFGHNEPEVAARWLVRFAQQNGSWHDFTQHEINSFTKCNFSFSGLIESGHILKNEDGTFSFTDKFINTCYAKQMAPRV